MSRYPVDDARRRNTSDLETAAESELEDRARVELAVRKIAVDGNLHVRLNVEPFPDHDRNARRCVDPVAAADQHRGAVEGVLLPMQPVDPRVSHDFMRQDSVRPS